jgi:LysW-gamma-L-lysine carboxypeptidase
MDMVRIYSPAQQEEGIAQHLVETMSQLGFQAGRDDVGNAVGHLGTGPHQIILLGHMDTAPGEPPVRCEGQVLYGRGSVDAKGPLAAFVIAAARAGPLADLRITVIGAVEEETYSSKGARHVLGVYRPDLCIIGEPSRWNRITLGYKGVLQIRYRLRCPMSHTAGPEHGVCEAAVTFWQRVSSWIAGRNLGQESQFECLDASLREIRSDDDGLQGWVEMAIGFRLPLGADVDALRTEIEAQRGSAQVEELNYEPPFRARKANALTSALLNAIRAEGGQPAFVMKTGTSDMNVVGPVWDCPIVAYGPGDSVLDHTPDEHLDLDEYLRSIRVLTRTLQRLASTAGYTAPGGASVSPSIRRRDRHSP